eukprot:scaffold966_cov415-Prasinococcus_capsulatus_cf.AAC.33
MASNLLRSVILGGNCLRTVSRGSVFRNLQKKCSRYVTSSRAAPHSNDGDSSRGDGTEGSEVFSSGGSIGSYGGANMGRPRLPKPVVGAIKPQEDRARWSRLPVRTSENKAVPSIGYEQGQILPLRKPAGPRHSRARNVDEIMMGEGRSSAHDSSNGHGGVWAPGAWSSSSNADALGNEGTSCDDAEEPKESARTGKGSGSRRNRKGHEKEGESLTAVIDRITYRNEENGYTILKVKAAKGTDIPDAPAMKAPQITKSGRYRRRTPTAKNVVTVIGILHYQLFPGANMKFTGSWEMDKKYGLQFKMESAEEVAPDSIDEIVNYLAGGRIKGVGKVTAKRLVEAYGADTLNVLESPDAIQKLIRIPKIGTATAHKIKENFDRDRDLHMAYMFLEANKFPKHLCKRVVEKLGTETEGLLRADPYLVLCRHFGISFDVQEQLAESIGLSRNTVNRTKSALVQSLRDATRSGHCYLSKSTACANAHNILNKRLCPELGEVTPMEIERVADSMKTATEGITLREVRPVDGEARYYLPALYEAEMEVAQTIANLALRKELLFEDEPVDSARVSRWLDQLQKTCDSAFTDEQRAVVLKAATSPLLIITGGPGVGKTFTIESVVKLWKAMGRKVALCAPTGRAAQTLQSRAGCEASTIHRLLKCVPTKGSAQSELGSFDMDSVDDDPVFVSFLHNDTNPIECDALLIDETSMVDVPLAFSLLRALPRKAQLVLVGDANQLPPVGPGPMFKEIIGTESLRDNVLHLTKIFRQASQSKIVGAAYSVLNGDLPELHVCGSPEEALDAFGSNMIDASWIQLRRSADIQEAVVDTICALKRRGFNVRERCQVLTPRRAGSLGAKNLNMLVEEEFNPRDDSMTVLQSSDYSYAVGDRIVQLVNDYDNE